MPRNRELDPTLVVEVYNHLLRELGRASCSLVADYLERRGVLNSKGKAYHRTTVYYALRSTPEGRQLLSETKKRMGR